MARVCILYLYRSNRRNAVQFTQSNYAPRLAFFNAFAMETKRMALAEIQGKPDSEPKWLGPKCLPYGIEEQMVSCNGRSEETFRFKACWA